MHKTNANVNIIVEMLSRTTYDQATDREHFNPTKNGLQSPTPYNPKLTQLQTTSSPDLYDKTRNHIQILEP